jgi:hypothetical protein
MGLVVLRLRDGGKCGKLVTAYLLMIEGGANAPVGYNRR